MYAGRIVETAQTAAMFDDPKHPYTRGLMSAVPHPDPDRRMHFEMSGEVAHPADLPPGCPFHPRCRHAQDDCKSGELPALELLADGPRTACHHVDEITD